MTSVAGKLRSGLLPVQPWLDRLGPRLRELGLNLSFWDAGGELLGMTEPCGPVCQQFRTRSDICEQAMGRLAHEVRLEDGPCSATCPAGGCMLAVPIHQRRRLLGVAVACFLARGSPETEEFARACGQVRLDRQAMADLCRRSDCHEAACAKLLHSVLGWLVDDEHAKAVAEKELATLSINLANTYEELSMLYRISGSMRVTQSGTEFFKNICRELLEVIHLQAAVVLLHRRGRNDSADRMEYAGQLPLPEAQLRQLFRRYLEPRLGASRTAIVDNQFATHAAHLGGQVGRIRTLIAVPLAGGEGLKGVLVGMNKLTGEFDSTDLKLISSIGSQAGVFLENYHLYEDLQDLLMGMLHALTASIDAKDPYTCGHSRRVALISRKLAEMSGFAPQRVGRMYLAGLLHDIGKIGMPEAVLLKTGRLTDEEYSAVKLHPEVGARILGGIRQMEDIVPVVLYHHERPDGRGYPRGLAGAEIPIEALIVGLADGFDAMTSSRTYRAAMPLEAVIAEIRRCSGTQFDPRLVERLLSLDLKAFLEELRTASAAEVELAQGVHA